jgi:hypothetical protein
MCPDKKLKWFKDHGRTAAQIRDIKKLVVTRWNETYKGDEGTEHLANVAPRRGKVHFKCFTTPSLDNYNFIAAQIKMGCFTGA